MKRVRPFLFMLLALLAGWAIGLYSTEHYYEKWIKRYRTHIAFDGVNDRFTALKALRTGDTNGMAELLESQMDSQIMVFGAMIQDLPADQLQPWDLRLLTQLREYRAAHPRKTNRPEIDHLVAGVLSSTSIQNHQ
jgi:hypothetical protein